MADAKDLKSFPDNQGAGSSPARATKLNWIIWDRPIYKSRNNLNYSLDLYIAEFFNYQYYIFIKPIKDNL